MLILYITHPALRKGPLFTKNAPPPFSTFLQHIPIFHFFYKKHPMSFPDYGPDMGPEDQNLSST